MYELDKAAFGQFLAALRKEQGLTQKQLAAKLFVSDKAVSKWERGLSIPDTALLIPLAEALGVTVTELLLCRRCRLPSQSPPTPSRRWSRRPSATLSIPTEDPVPGRKGRGRNCGILPAWPPGAYCSGPVTSWGCRWTLPPPFLP